ncbi:hypothetical protein FSP39_007648 [Pinctada imbricata]|uniref:Uncharacterized protein n=1 Tax=Pinctada imbricata TaxID=66713 RepID=A0AA88XVH7_PINIB|nr:hypothetical protein FSP39_007648 [Pinctada imbricata]
MTGKTSLINAFLGNKFTDKYTATASDVFQSSMIHYGERFDIKISDFAGERESEIVSSKALQESDVIIVCYSVDDGESYESIRSFWAPQSQAIKRKAHLILVGLQSDKRSENNSMEYISEQEGRTLMREIHAEGFYECFCQK